MDIFDIDAARTDLSKLVDRAADGEPFVIAKDGKPMVKVVSVAASTDGPKNRIGFLKGVYAIPDDVKAFGRGEIQEMFHGPKE